MAEGKKGRGRPTKFDESILTQAEDLCRIGALDEDLADFFRVKGVPTWEVATQLGHRFEGYGMTERYTSASPDYLAQACAALDLLLTQILQGEALARADSVPERKIA